MTRYYKATCGTGIALRTSASREYSHAVMKRDTHNAYGFSGRRDLAEKAKAQWRNRDELEVVEAIEITRKEYMAEKAAHPSYK